jgi:hypothetical protein
MNRPLEVALVLLDGGDMPSITQSFLILEICT